ncbi:MAG TPA: DUF6671 family protein [Flavisolibacter sp.]|jgi:hypothetical protein
MTEQAIIEKYFGKRALVIATKHEKEKVLKPLMEDHLGVSIVVANNIDTDDFGTFSGEVERQASPLETARKKCQAARKLTGAELVLASEGSFGGHPVIGFLPADEEILLLIDYKYGVEYKAKVISTQTNFRGNEYFDWEPLLFFASEVNFPSHGLILRKEKNDYSEIHKGITDWDRLKESFYYFRNKHGKVFVETDMRALYNPMRMKVIEEAGHKLIGVIHNLCPLCQAPGFEVKEVIRGLPCSQCSAPTQTAKAYVYLCQHCGHAQTKNYPNKKEKEDPMFCDECNP